MTINRIKYISSSIKTTYTPRYFNKNKNKQALLCYILCGSLLASWFQSEFRPISALYKKFHTFYTDFFFRIPLFWKQIWMGLCILYPFRGQGERARDAQIRGGGGHAGGKTYYAGVRAKLFWYPGFGLNLA